MKKGEKIKRFISLSSSWSMKKKKRSDERVKSQKGKKLPIALRVLFVFHEGEEKKKGLYESCALSQCDLTDWLSYF